jgi:hypothetical protein
MNLTKNKIKMLSNKKTLSIINFLINNNEEVNWSNDNYKIVKESKGNLLVVCKENGFTTKLTNEDLKKCYTDKWAVRQYELIGFPIMYKNNY